MKKVMCALILAALAATGVFAQNTPWTNVQDDRVVLRPQVPIQSAPLIDVKGNVTYPVSEYKIVLYYPVVLHNEQLLPGYKRTISIPANAPYKVQIKNASNQMSVIDLAVLSVQPFKLQGKDEDYIKVVLRVPSNYVQIFLTFDAKFVPLQAGEDEEIRKVISIMGNDPKMFVQPAVIPVSAPGSVTTTAGPQQQFVPATTTPSGNSGGLR